MRLLQKKIVYVFILFLTIGFSYAQEGGENTNLTCDTAIPVCPDNNFGVNIPNVLGNISAEEGPFYGCLGSQPRPMWFYMRVAQSGNAIFDLNQYTQPDGNGTGLDVDFALWGPFESQDACDLLTEDNMLDCSFSGAPVEIVDFQGGTATTVPDTEAPGYEPGYVNEGEYYILLVTNYNSSGNAGFVNLLPRYPEMSAAFDCSILGPVYNFCDIDGDGQETINLDYYIDSITEGDQNIGVTFHSTSYGANNNEDFVDSNQTLTGESLTVYARKENYFNGDVQVIVISFNLIPVPELQEDTLSYCDNGGDGTELFDLTLADVLVNDDEAEGITYSYYTSQEDADAGENAIEDPTYYSSGVDDIYVRAEAGDCYATTIIHLELNDTIDLADTSDSFCDADGDGVETIDLTQFNDIVLNGNQGTIQYYENESDAIAGNDQFIQAPEAYETETRTLYAYVAGSGGCNAVAEVVITINESPQLTTVTEPYEYCDELNDGTETIDLTDALADIISNTTGLTVSYYLSEEDLNNGENAITDPANYLLTDETVIYILVANENCSNFTSVTFDLLDGVEVTNIPLSACDDGTGTATYDLTDANVADTFDSISYFATMEDAEAGENEIDNPTSYTTTVPTTVYALVTVGDCSSIAEISLGLFDELTLNPVEDTVCDTDGDLMETFDLNDYVSDILGNSTGDIFFYLNQQDAEDGNTNYLTSIDAYNTATVTLYVRVENGNCSATTTLTLNVLDAPVANDVTTPYTYCDDFMDGTETVDLTVAFEDVVTSTGGLVATYYLSEDDAENNNTDAAITNPTAYEITGTTVIYIRVAADDCADVAMVTFDLTDGISVTTDTLFACYADSGQGTFDLTTAVTTTATTISFHTNAADGMTGDNPIADPSNYTGAVPSTVYVFVEEGDCANTAEISLEYYAEITIPLEVEYSICSGNSVTVNAGNFVSYLWSTGETTQEIVIDELGTYSVEVTDSNGCTGMHEFDVVSGNAPSITNVEEGQNSLTLTADGGEAPYQYSIGGFVYQDSNEFGNLPAGTYNVFVRGADGCVSTVEIASVFQWPTMFTPNGDGINDVWRVPGLEVYPNSMIRIYDRYGTLVYQATVSSNELWDGSDMSGNKVSTQDYWYILDVSDGRKYTGHVTVKNRTEKGN